MPTWRPIRRLLPRLLHRQRPHIVYARASQGDGVDGRVVVKIAAGQFDGPHILGELTRLRQGQDPDQGGDQDSDEQDDAQATTMVTTQARQPLRRFSDSFW